MKTNQKVNQPNFIDSYIPAGTSTANCRLKPEFVTGQNQPLKIKKLPKPGMAKIYQLPFADSKHGPGSYWILPASNGYFGGYETGEAMALMLLKVLKEEPEPMPWLTYVSDSFCYRFSQVEQGSEEYAGLRGQHAGFYGALVAWLHKSAVIFRAELDEVTFDDLLVKASAGLNFDDKAYHNSLGDDD